MTVRANWKLCAFLSLCVLAQSLRLPPFVICNGNSTLFLFPLGFCRCCQSRLAGQVLIWGFLRPLRRANYSLSIGAGLAAAGGRRTDNRQFRRTQRQSEAKEEADDWAGKRRRNVECGAIRLQSQSKRKALIHLVIKTGVECIRGILIQGNYSQ
jgi:hypothetical protein